VRGVGKHIARITRLSCIVGADVNYVNDPRTACVTSEQEIRGCNKLCAHTYIYKTASWDR
jgi:hypothetical protein